MMPQYLDDKSRTNADRVTDMISRLVERFEDASATQAMLAAISDDKAFWWLLFEKRYEAHGLNLVHNALLAQLLMLLMAMYDGRDSRRDNRASLPSIMHHLADKAVVRQLVQDARTRPSGGAYNGCAAARSIMRARIRYNALTTRASHQERVQRLRYLRNEHGAHALVQQPTRSGLPYSWFQELRRDSAPIISDLCFAVKGRDPQFDDAYEEWSRRAVAFWASLRAGLQTPEHYGGDLRS